jgi:Tol biopolymer transport system component
VIYLADQEVNNSLDLYSVPIGGGSARKLNGAPLYKYRDDQVVDTRVMDHCKFSPDSQRVVFMADSATIPARQLFSVPLNGGPPVRLNGDHECVNYFSITTDSQAVIYRSTGIGADKAAYCRVPIGGGSPVKFFESTPTTSYWKDDYRLTPNLKYFVYRAMQPELQAYGLFSLEIATGRTIKLNSDGTTDDDVNALEDFRITPDGKRVVYHAYKDQGMGLHSVAVTGGPTIKVRDCSKFQGAYPVGAYEISPDSTRIVFVNHPGDQPGYALYHVPVMGGPVTKISKTLETGDHVADYVFTPNSLGVVYIDSQPYKSPLGVFSSMFYHYNAVSGAWQHYR